MRLQLQLPSPRSQTVQGISSQCMGRYLRWGRRSALQLRQAEFTSYKDYIGLDITSLVTLPVWIMEPFTILQRLAEIMEYSPHLDTAAGTEDQYERCPPHVPLSPPPPSPFPGGP